MNDLVQTMAALRRDAGQRAAAACAERGAAGAGEPAGRPDPDGAPAVADLAAVLRRRRATRFFDDRPVTSGQLAEMLQAGSACDAALWPAEHQARPLEFLVVAGEVTGLPRAVHRWGPDGFEPLVALDGTELSTLVLQPEFALAPALVLAIGSLESALQAHGSHGHRQLLERSGAVCEAAWLTAVHQGLEGSIFAGFLPSALKRLAGIDGFRRTQLLALAVGHAVGGA
ncbi:nitroreductase family protein [Kitasatospora sp. NPDC002227]|uniref:nitroreductase family protein n=1 Tax=Kitasatospora sp. NPDC002227 TaxID=3154773 RepID=UPI003322E19D